VRSVIDCEYCISMALLIKTIAIEEIPYEMAADKLKNEVTSESLRFSMADNDGDD
jgi:hypothetical protein